ncbi:hypothetical protein CEXT_395841 [Caerostris extrusa]|uniref:Uncharacterized protein n=1 Tax=Caerostris extrusa TaxID=172846 RepID=A0AAV4SH07_CAEEX|nr:hypothetical protein CEXT_395841 [Caerostris extrusa]
MQEQPDIPPYKAIQRFALRKTCLVQAKRLTTTRDIKRVEGHAVWRHDSPSSECMVCEFEKLLYQLTLRGPLEHRSLFIRGTMKWYEAQCVP